MTPPVPATRVVAVRLGALGDMIMFLPALETLAARFDGTIDVLHHGPWGQIVLRRSAAYREGFRINTTKWRPLFLPTVHRRALAWTAAPRPAAIVAFEGVPKLEHLLRHRWLRSIPILRGVDLEYGPDEHRIDRELRIASQAHPEFPPPIAPVTRTPAVQVAADETDAARSWLATLGIDPERPIHLIQVGNRRTMGGRLRQRRNPKDWPRERWVDLIRGIVEREPDANVLLCGVPAEHAAAVAIAAECQSPRVRSVADQLPLPRLFALSALAQTMVSLDTGPAHVAAACGVNCVVLFGVTDPRVFAPRGRGRVIAVQGEGMVDISAAAVLDAWAGLRR